MRLILLTVALIPVLFLGCATEPLPTGSDFISSVVYRIENGVTTSQQILGWLGEPYHKERVSASSMVWIYNWSRPAADPNVVPFGHRNIGNSGYRKTLWLLFVDDVVINYSYDEGLNQ